MMMRPAAGRDAPALTALAHAAKRHWRYSEALIRLWRADLTVTPAFIAHHPVWCAVEGTTIAGFYALSREGDVFELEHFWVRPRRMGAGIGRRLLAHACELAGSLGGCHLDIAADPYAEAFYLHVGAYRVGDVPARPCGRTLPLLRVDLDAGARLFPGALVR